MLQCVKEPRSLSIVMTHVAGYVTPKGKTACVVRFLACLSRAERSVGATRVHRSNIQPTQIALAITVCAE